MAFVSIQDDYLIYLRRKFPHRPPFKLDFQVFELCKFLYLASFLPHSAVLISGELQVLWHAMLIETRAYRHFCGGLPGRKLVHHSSSFFPHAACALDRQTARQNEMAFYAAYVVHFEGFIEDALTYWPGVGRIMETAELYSMDSLNHFLCARQSTPLAG